MDNQNEIDRLLNRAFIFSIVWLAGFGSLIAVLSAKKAKALAKASGIEIKHSSRYWWSLIVGILGMVIWFPIIIIAIVNQFT